MAAVPRGHPIWTPPHKVQIKKKDVRTFYVEIICQFHVTDSVSRETIGSHSIYDCMIPRAVLGTKGKAKLTNL
jgi:hypothetical protein